METARSCRSTLPSVLYCLALPTLRRGHLRISVVLPHALTVVEEAAVDRAVESSWAVAQHQQLDEEREDRVGLAAPMVVYDVSSSGDNHGAAARGSGKADKYGAITSEQRYNRFEHKQNTLLLLCFRRGWSQLCR